MREKAEKREDIGKVRELHVFMEREKREIMRKEKGGGSCGERRGRERAVFLYWCSYLRNWLLAVLGSPTMHTLISLQR